MTDNNIVITNSPLYLHVIVDVFYEMANLSKKF
jgi:hypothetical protein